MERMLNPRIEKQTIYEIYRACRFCGAGAGYKMPIMQSVMDGDGPELDLRHKIRECVQLEVNHDDKMPPLICELCVDKVNDFYEFLELCRKTNKRTRLRLGLPMQAVSKGSSDGGGDCILGVTEPVYVNDDSGSDEQPLKQKTRTKAQKKVYKKEPVKVKIEKTTRSQSTKRSPTPPRSTRFSRGTTSDNSILTRTKSNASSPKSILKKRDTVKIEDSTPLLSSRTKRSADRACSHPVVPVKKVKIAVEPTSPPPKPRPPNKASRPPPPPAVIRCVVCRITFKTTKGMSSHVKTHTVTFTNCKLACNACRLWFTTNDEAAAHHRRHRTKCLPYHCRRCMIKYKYQDEYDEHFVKDLCVPEYEVPDVKCPACWRLFPTETLLRGHRCPGAEGRIGGKCSKCSKHYALMKNLKRHENLCTYKKKENELIVDPVLLSKLKPLQVRVARCDPLLVNAKQGHYDVTTVTEIYGLDSKCVYPFASSIRILNIKSEPKYDEMVNIRDDVKEEFSANYIHWDSSSESDEEEPSSPVKKPLESLARLSLKTLFSQQCLGKVPRKKRKVKSEAFDVSTEFDMSKNIDSLICNLSDDDDMGANKDVVRVNNNMFDELFKSNVSEVVNDKDSKETPNDSTSGDKDTSEVALNDKDTQNNELSAVNNENDGLESIDKDGSGPESNNSVINNNDVSSDKETPITDINTANDDKEIDNSVLNDEREDNDTLSNDKQSNDTPKIVCDDVEITDVSHNKADTNKVDTDSDVADKVAEVTDIKDKGTNEHASNVNDEQGNASELNKSILEKENKAIEDSSSKENVSENELTIDNDSSKDNLSNENKLETISVNKDNICTKDIETVENTAISNSSNDKNVVTKDNINDISTNDEDVNTEESLSSDVKNSVKIDCMQKKISGEDKIEFTGTSSCDSENDTNVQTHSNNKTDVQSNDKRSNDTVPKDKQINKSYCPKTIVNGSKVDEMSLDSVSDTEIDDKKLMDDLNAQIGDSPECTSHNNDITTNDIQSNDNDTNDSKDDKITLEDLISKKDSGLNTMDLDNVSDDDFNFDA